MADLKYYDVILKPIITEKTMSEMSERRYVFYVHPDATKVQVKEAIEKMFEGVEVAKVNTMNLAGKKKRRGYIIGRTAARKKAIVKLKETGQDIELFQGM